MIRELFEDDTREAPVHRISLEEIDRRAGRIRRRRTALGAAVAATAVVIAGSVALPGPLPASDHTLAQPTPATPTEPVVYLMDEDSAQSPGELEDVFYPASEGPMEIFVHCTGTQAYAGVWVGGELVTQAPCGPVTELRWDNHADPDRPAWNEGMVRVKTRVFPYTEEPGTLTAAEIEERAEQARDEKMFATIHVYRYPGLFVPPTTCAQPLVVDRAGSGRETLEPVRCELD
ncbi:hypothetical protein FDA94_19365 [Herbidospora galbida]|uniref:Uncharacterized protein n=1 Tax=Herbidospora galbida TaxID=2575442 RepID=A0A4U3MD30_9ACTN|nr:hypothetical protein [Herbidospora galbida]TKK86951.1 hypothetical protein FDA94_19365 [Herbidospora galbida]